MIKPRIPSGPPPKPLDEAELVRVHTWQRNMYRYYGVAMILIAAGWFAMTRYSDVPWIRPGLFAMVIALMAVGAFVQFRERCPRCGFQLGRQARLILPAKCKSCGVGFPRAGETDYAPRA